MSTYIRYIYSEESNPDSIKENTILKKFCSIKPRKVDPDKNDSLGTEMKRLYDYIREGHPEARNILVIQTYDKDTRRTLGLRPKGNPNGWEARMETAFNRGRDVGDFE